MLLVLAAAAPTAAAPSRGSEAGAIAPTERTPTKLTQIDFTPTESTIVAPAPASAALNACVARARPGDSPGGMMATPGRFECRLPRMTPGPGDFWMRLTPLDAAAVRGLDQVSYIGGWHAASSLTARHADGSLATVRLDNRTLAAFTRIGSREVIPVPGDASPVTALLLRIDDAPGPGGLVVKPLLINQAAGHNEERRATAIYSAFAGLCAALLVYNLVLWLAVRERFQITYCATLLSMLTYALASSGALAILLPEADVSLQYRVSYPALALVAALALRFFIYFLEADAVPKGLRWLVNLHGLSLVGVALAMSFASSLWLHRLGGAYIWLFVPVPVLAVIMAIAAVRRNSRAIRVLMLAWAAPVTMAAISLVRLFVPMGSSPLVQHSIVIGLLLEALLSSLAMASRIKRIVQERDTARAEEQIARRLADIDPLTGLLNRRALLVHTLAWRHEKPLRLLLIDIDHFKAINDAHGHEVGDEVLREIAALLAELTALRASVGRLGGEEFALVGTASELSAPFALAILSAVRGHRFVAGVRVTVSIGIAEGMVQEEADWLALYRRADAALYAAKGAGRNRVIDQGEASAGTAPAPAPAAPGQPSVKAGATSRRPGTGAAAL